jgi:hypothetical protein
MGDGDRDCDGPEVLELEDAFTLLLKYIQDDATDEEREDVYKVHSWARGLRDWYLRSIKRFEKAIWGPYLADNYNGELESVNSDDEGDSDPKPKYKQECVFVSFTNNDYDNFYRVWEDYQLSLVGDDSPKPLTLMKARGSHPLQKKAKIIINIENSANATTTSQTCSNNAEVRRVQPRAVDCNIPTCF